MGAAGAGTGVDGVSRGAPNAVAVAGADGAAAAVDLTGVAAAELDGALADAGGGVGQ